MKLIIPVPSDVNFWSTVCSHGWSVLPPFVVDRKKKELQFVVTLPSQKNIPLEVIQSSTSELTVNVSHPEGLKSNDRRKIIEAVRTCLRLDEDFSEFYREAKRHEQFRWACNVNAGRMLRAPTVFEDAVKMICTTNCSWALTEIMVQNLCTKLGEKIDESHFAFPQPAAIAASSEKYLRKEIRAGYRSPYLLELSQKITSGNLNVESWRTSRLQTEELFRYVRSVKGIGPYAAGNILKLLGRYDYLGIDSWCRAKFNELHKNGRKASDRVIEKHYAPFGKWRGLFFWLDLTKEWYKKEFPL
jgi:N-glycosylase/DNA lyase